MRAAIRDGVAELWLDRPERRNALDLKLAAEFLAEVDALRDRDEVRVVLLAADGPAFCVGGDISAFDGADDPRATVRDSAQTLHEGLLALGRLGVPVVARVHGAVAGAGLGLLFAADLAVASESAHFTLGYTAIGFTPDGGATWWLPRLVGHRRAVELALTNRRVPASEAAAIGLVTETVPDAELDERVGALTSSLAAGPTGAYAATLALLRGSANTELSAQMAREAECIGEAAGSANGREGLAAFLAKRPADFKR